MRFFRLSIVALAALILAVIPAAAADFAELMAKLGADDFATKIEAV